jgi:hypothetical protein
VLMAQNSFAARNYPVAANMQALSKYVAADYTSAVVPRRDSNCRKAANCQSCVAAARKSGRCRGCDSHLNLPGDCRTSLNAGSPSNLSCDCRVLSQSVDDPNALEGNCAESSNRSPLVRGRGPSCFLARTSFWYYLSLPVHAFRRLLPNQTAHCADGIAACRSTVRAACSTYGDCFARLAGKPDDYSSPQPQFGRCDPWSEAASPRNYWCRILRAPAHYLRC